MDTTNTNSNNQNNNNNTPKKPKTCFYCRTPIKRQAKRESATCACDKRNKSIDNLKEQGIPVIDNVIDLSTIGHGLALNAQVLKLLHALFPDTWSDVTSPSDLTIARLSGAMTNCVFAITGPPLQHHHHHHHDSSSNSSSSSSSTNSSVASSLASTPASSRPASPKTHLSKLQSPLNFSTDSFQDHFRNHVSGPRRILLRVYGVGVDQFVRRSRELFWLCKLAEIGFGPRLLGVFSNGRFEEYLLSDTLRKEDLRDPRTSREIARELAKLHFMVSTAEMEKHVAKVLERAMAATKQQQEQIQQVQNQQQQKDHEASIDHIVEKPNTKTRTTQLHISKLTSTCPIPHSVISSTSIASMAGSSDISSTLSSTIIPAATSRDLPLSPEPPTLETELWETLNKWYELAQKAEQAMLSRTNPPLPTIQREKLLRINVSQIGTEMNALRQKLRHVPSPIVFSHNDTQYGNILRLHADEEGQDSVVKKGDEEFDNVSIGAHKKSIIIVDYEYAGLNYRGFDIGDHFMEWAADYHCPTPHIMHWDRYPNEQEQVNFLTAYLDMMLYLQQSPLRNAQDSESVLKRQVLLKELMGEVRCYGMATHVFWTLWGVMQAAKSEIEFDYLGYAEGRIVEFRNKWDLVFAESR